MSPMRQSSRPANDLFAKLAQAIKNGEFTPFLGAGASSLREINEFTLPWNQILQNIAVIASQLKTNEGCQFLESFVDQRLGFSKDQLARVLLAANKDSETDGTGIQLAFRKNGLVHLQTELINAAVALTLYFGKRFSEGTPSITELASCSVPFDPAEQDGRVAMDQLLKAAAIAQDLREEDGQKRESPFLHEYPSARRGLEIKRIHEKLLILIATLLGEKRDRYESELERHKLGKKLPIPDDIDAVLSSDCGELRLDALHWMSELIWYTLRYWIPCYPTTPELAFELSLRVANAPARRAELAQAAQALQNDHSANKGKSAGSLVEDMASLIKYCEYYQREVPESSIGTSAFYHAIAIASLHQYEVYKDGCLTDDEPLEEILESNDGVDRKSRPIVPFVFSTNFDNALEQVFAANDIGYHVVYPTIGGEGQKGIPTTWRLKTIFAESRNMDPIDDKWGDVPAEPTVPPKFGQLIGPLIFKIHGAPCLKVKDSGFRHWLVLSETGYLEALANASNLPASIPEALGDLSKSRRCLWFLGYSMSDWNVRLRLFEHCKGHQGFRGTVDIEKDVYRTALLLNERINVEQWYADLSLLPQKILDLFMIQGLQSSKKVMELVQKLERLLERRGRM